jgi:hypothetical protein
MTTQLQLPKFNQTMLEVPFYEVRIEQSNAGYHVSLYSSRDFGGEFLIPHDINLETKILKVGCEEPQILGDFMTQIWENKYLGLEAKIRLSQYVSK